MRMTLNIADDVLLAAKQIARWNGLSMGVVIGDLARLGLHAKQSRIDLARFGIHPLPKRGGVVTHQIINRLRGDDTV